MGTPTPGNSVKETKDEDRGLEGLTGRTGRSTTSWPGTLGDLPDTEVKGPPANGKGTNACWCGHTSQGAVREAETNPICTPM